MLARLAGDAQTAIALAINLRVAPTGTSTPETTAPTGNLRVWRNRIPLTLAQVQVIKHRQGKKLKTVEVVKAHDSQRRIDQALEQMGYQVANTSTVERFNGKARRMNAYQVQRTLAFAHRQGTRHYLAW